MTDAVARLLADGWAVVPLVAGNKNPSDPGWLKKVYTAKDFPPGSNVGVKLGEASGWRVDADLDAPGAVLAAQTLLPITGLVHGRPGKPSSHWWYVAPGTQSKAYKALDGTTLCELRAHGQQTVVPPSVHPSGDVLAWEHERAPLTIEADALRHAVRAVAIAALFGAEWPEGSRHAAAGVMAGFLLRVGYEGPWVERIVKCAARIAKDEEADDRARYARDTAKKFAAGEKTTGAPKLGETFTHGDALAARVYEWMERPGADMVDRVNEHYFVAHVETETLVGYERPDHLTAPVLLMSFEQFRQRVYNQHVGKKKLSEFWLTHPKRRTFRDVVFAPPPLAVHPDDYNLWRGLAVAPDPAPDPEHRCARFLHHLHRVICNGDDDHFRYLLDLLAMTVQRPGAPSGVALVLRGDPGAGKGSLIDNFGRLFGRHYIQVDKQVLVTGRFNHHLSGKVVLFADEAVWGGDKREVGALRRLVTEKTLTIERKFMDASSEPNCLHLFMATNEDWVWPASLRERRGFILDVERKDFATHGYFNDLHDEWDHHGGAAAFLALMLARPLGRRLAEIPKTEALIHQQDLSMDGFHAWWKDILLAGETSPGSGWPEYLPAPFLFEHYSRSIEALGQRVRVLQMLLHEKMRDVLPNSAVRKRRRCLVNIARSGPPHMVNALTNGWVIPSLRECRDAFDAKTGTRTTWPPIEGEDEPRPLEAYYVPPADPAL